MTRRIVQFGTSRFLQAHVDLFVHEARQAGQDIGPITVVKTTPGVERQGRVAALRNPAGFPVRVRGYRDQALVDETIQVRSVDQALSVAQDWATIVAVFADAADIVVTNVGDRGYEVTASDLTHALSPGEAPASFPAKLLHLLIARHEAGARPLLILPCELLSSNGQVLSQRITDLAAQLPTSRAFKTWLGQSVSFANTLVDRIVSEPIEPVGAIAEPYALWAIQSEAKTQPFHHPALVYTDKLEPYARLKLHILNLGHTVLAEIWLKGRRAPGETVREILADTAVSDQLRVIYDEEVIPGFAVHGMGDEAARYVQTTIDRFRNPFLNHKIADIAQNHTAKIDLRIRAFHTWVGDRAKLPRLGAICGANA